MNLPFWFTLYGVYALSFCVTFLYSLFFHIYIWQLKEYRVDRMISFLKTSHGLRILLNPISIIKWLLLFPILFSVLLVIPEDNMNFVGYYVLFTLILSIQLIFLLVGRKNRKRPKLTKRVGLVFLISSIFLLASAKIVSVLHPIWPLYYVIFISFPLFDRLLGPIVALSVFISQIPKDIALMKIRNEAKKRIQSMPKLIVIGITGSVGKTSTKEFLAKILELKYKVYKTPESINTQIGVAQYIVNHLKDDADILLVEMGAYKKGEIKDMCDMVQPKIGIITYIGSQHLELFGSMDNLIAAKYELIESLPKDGIAVFNAGNPECRNLSQRAKKEGKNVQVYGQNEEKIKKYPTPNLLGKQCIPNLLGAISVAEILNVPQEEIQNQVKNILPPRHTMEYKGKHKGATLIDDTFNSSRESVLSAIEYMKEYKGKKILVLSPLIELGSRESEIENEIKNAAKICDVVIHTDKYSLKQAREKIDAILDNKSIMVFEGKQAKKYLDTFL